MPKSKLAKNKTSVSTQTYLDIAEIRDDVVILKDGSIRSVLLASSINFALKSEDEQNAILQGYISLLNALDFSVQIVVQSRTLNIDGYLADLVRRASEQTNDLLRTQIQEYRAFISELVTLGGIMGKRFYIVVPYAPGKDSKKSFMSQISTTFSPGKVIALSEKLFVRYKEKLDSRVNAIVSGLGTMGVTAIPLPTQSLVELYYSSYNPELSQIQKLPKEEEMKIDEYYV
ncbi:hypothetical protein BK004_03980 [bacterium CG10_46_32]|nr:MAG: hypothetical protein BK004_03980 [bacterium CG10_46_32]PIR55854.1 MAG: hypothetical protein COU73_04015 [Parcubacteria group bacterium CG10_big_fil_rev_8_21_14_0_10_46_32]